MSRKHYIRVAAAINDLYHSVGQGRGAEVKDFAMEMSAIFKADNSNFDHRRFMDACFKPL